MIESSTKIFILLFPFCIGIIGMQACQNKTKSTRNQTLIIHKKVEIVPNDSIKNKNYNINNAPITLNDSINSSRHPFLSALDNSDINRIQYIIKNGVDINSKFSDKFEDCLPCPNKVTILHLACLGTSDQSLEIVDLLLKNGADINIKNGEGLSPLNFAVFSHQNEIVQKLLAHGAKLNIKESPALHSAAMFSDYKMLNFLLAHGADPNQEDLSGNTALHACFLCCGDGFGSSINIKDRINAFNLLYASGANIFKKNSKGESVIDYLKEGWYFPIAEILLQKSILKWKDINIKNNNPFDTKKIVIDHNFAQVRSGPSLNAPKISTLKSKDTVFTDNFIHYGDSVTLGKYKGNFDIIKFNQKNAFIFNGILKSCSK